MSFCSHCISGVRHEGTPTGSYETINGVKTYVAIPSSEYPKNKAVLFLPDIFGLELENSRLLADDYAKNGFQTYIPDYLNGDPVPADFLGGKFDLNAWFPSHGPAQTRPPLDKVIAGLKERGITELAAVGYCFGARYAFDLAFEHVVKVVAVAHPSLLEVPDDLVKFKDTGIPLHINSCEIDPQYPVEKQKIGDEVLGNGTNKGPNYERTHWPGCTHGFAVRGDISDPRIKEGREGAFKATIEWLIKHL